MTFFIPYMKTCTYYVYLIIRKDISKKTNFYKTNKQFVIDNHVLQYAIKLFNCNVVDNKLYIHKGIKHKRFINYLMRGGYKNGH